MTWQNILKISTEDAISDAKRFADDEVKEGKREQILDVWRKMGLDFTDSETIQGDPSILIYPKGGEPEGMFNRHFDFLEAYLYDDEYGFLIKIPKESPSEGKTERDSVGSVNDAKRDGELYLKTLNKKNFFSLVPQKFRHIF